MSQCVPSWNLDDETSSPKFYMRSHSNSRCPDVSVSNYEVAELTWENGQLSIHGLGVPRVPCKPVTAAAAAITSTVSSCPTKNSWDKPRTNGTLESIVHQATRLPHHEKQSGGKADHERVQWIEHPKAAATAAALASATMTMDALVPCSNRTDDRSINRIDPIHDLGIGVVGCSTHVESCSEATTRGEDYVLLPSKRAKVARLPVMQEWSSRDQSVGTNDTFGMNKSQHMSMDTYEMELGSLVFTSTSMASPESTNSGKHCTKENTSDDHDSVSHIRPQEEDEKKKNKEKSSVSTKRSRAAAIHNQSERKRRDKINQRMKTLQKLVPNSNKTDKASVLDEVIDHLKQLQAHVQMMSRMNMAPIMMPMTMQQQFQMSSMMAPTGMAGLGMVGMGMGMGGVDVDTNIGHRPNIPAIPPMLHPTLFMPMPTSDHPRFQTPPPPMAPADPFCAFVACQPMAMDQYSRMAAMYQQLQQPPAANSKSYSSLLS